MIKNEKQYQITSKKLDEFKEAISHLKNSIDVNPDLRSIQIGALQAQIEVMESDLEEYLQLKGGQIRQIEIKSFRELPEVMIKARIAKRLTQTELAEKLKMKTQQLQRYEWENYESASLSRICEVLLALDINSMNITVPIAKPPLLLDWHEETLKTNLEKIRQQRALLSIPTEERKIA